MRGGVPGAARPPDRVSTFADAVSAAVGEPVALGATIGGGSISRVTTAETTSGRRLVVKSHTDAPDGMFACEARGLDWLRVAGGPRIPQVVAVSETAYRFIVLERIEHGRSDRRSDERLGQCLAALHRSGAPTFGLDHTNFLATIVQPNAQLATWPDFLAHRRLLPLTRMAVDSAVLPDRLARAVDHLAHRCEEFTGPAEPPARLHGDLWSGNALVDLAGEPVLIDPAVYGGHREMDLAMMRLFGGFSETVFTAYDEAFPLASGHAERVAFNQIVPLLAHVILFGGYVSQLSEVVGRYVPVG